MKAASFSTVLFTQVFQRYNYEQTFVNDMHACQADSSPDASILLSSLLAVFPVYISFLQIGWMFSYVVAVFSSKEKNAKRPQCHFWNTQYNSKVLNVSLKFKMSGFI